MPALLTAPPAATLAPKVGGAVLSAKTGGAALLSVVGKATLIPQPIAGAVLAYASLGPAPSPVAVVGSALVGTSTVG